MTVLTINGVDIEVSKWHSDGYYIYYTPIGGGNEVKINVPHKFRVRAPQNVFATQDEVFRRKARGLQESFCGKLNIREIDKTI